MPYPERCPFCGRRASEAPYKGCQHLFHHPAVAKVVEVDERRWTFGRLQVLFRWTRRP